MIEDVARALKESLRATSRDYFNRHLKHEYRLTRSMLYKALKTEVTDVIRAFNTWEEERQDRALAGDRNTIAGGYTVFEEKFIKDAIMAGLDKTKLNASFVRGMLFSGDQPKMQERWHPRVVKKNQNEVIIFLEEGELTATRGKAAKSDAGKFQPAIDYATQRMYEEARSAVFDYLHYPAKAGGGNPAKDLPPDMQGDELANLPGRTSHKRDTNLVKGHGKVKAKGGVEGIIVTTGDRQTTIGVMSMANDWEKFKKKKFTKPHHVSILKYIPQVQREITNLLAIEYNLESFSESPGIGIDDTLWVNLHATDQQGNRSKEIVHFDRDGIGRYIDAIAKDIHKNLGKQLAHLEPHLKGSPTKRERAVKVHNAMLVSQLLKNVKGKRRPDFRLKVNKKLLKEAKELKSKVKKHQKSKSFTDRKSTTKTRTMGGMAVAGAKGGKQRRRGKSVKQAKTTQSPIALRNLLNEALPQTVAKNMGSPALNFRTGRFANSARVDMVHQGARGGIGIDYTYMLNPYQTFEPGFKQGSTQRDPRKIIGESIRELATGILGRQPHTIRRV